MLTGNVGEWSEIYTLLKLLGDGKLIPGDENIERIKGLFYPIVKILRSGANGNFEYNTGDEIVISSEGIELYRIHVSVFKEKATFLFKKIKANRETTFPVPEIEEFMNEINCISLKADSNSKSDINIVIHDLRTGQQPLLGFSIKSQLGHASTLFNAGNTTNFIYAVEGINLVNEIENINSMFTYRGGKPSKDIKGRLHVIFNKGGRLKFIETENKVLSNNLTLIDSFLPKIMAEIIFDFNTSNRGKLKDLVSEIQLDNPIGYDLSSNHQFYSYKIKRLLTDIALGMVPSKVWSGKYHATGGYLIVKEDGDIICYHIYNKEEFENYLLNNTKLDTASSSRFGFGDLYLENGKVYFKLNLQIRFIK